MYAVALPDGNVYRIVDSSTAKFGDALRNDRTIQGRITSREKNIPVTVTGRLSGDTITFESVR
jgi:hypothetical protein